MKKRNILESFALDYFKTNATIGGSGSNPAPAGTRRRQRSNN